MTSVNKHQASHLSLYRSLQVESKWVGMQLHALLLSVVHALTQVQDSAKAIVEFAHSHLWTYMVGHLILLQNSSAFLNARRMQITFDL